MNNKPTQPGPDPIELGGVIDRVNQLGGASETFFRRLYRGLTRKNYEKRTIEEQNRLFSRALERREEEVQRLNAVLSTLDQGVIMQDEEGRLVIMNESARAMLGGVKSFWDSDLGALFERYRHTSTLTTEITPLSDPQRVTVNGRIVAAQLAAVADERGNRLGTLIVVRDVTNDALTDRLREKFITAISHELRTPMAIIKGVSEVILEQGESGKPNKRLLETLSRNVDVLDRMIVELLDISELDASNFAVRADSLDLEPLLDAVVKGMEPEIVRAGLSVCARVDEDVLKIRGDEQRLRWALGHLLQNSLYYTQEGGKVYLMAMRAEDSVTIQVVDEGVGISQKDMPHIFERFYRGEARAANGRLMDPRGLGQGLFIAQKVIEAHGGYITAQSEPGEGSLFTVVLPAS